MKRRRWDRDPRRWLKNIRALFRNRPLQVSILPSLPYSAKRRRSRRPRLCAQKFQSRGFVVRGRAVGRWEQMAPGREFLLVVKLSRVGACLCAWASFLYLPIPLAAFLFLRAGVCPCVFFTGC